MARKLPQYSGEDDEVDVVLWLEQFTIIADACNWSEIFKCAQLYCHLDGRAKRWFSSKQDHICKDWKLLATDMMEIFQVKFDLEQLHNRKQMPGELVIDFYLDVTKMCSKIFRVNSQMIEDYYFAYFMNGLVPKLSAAVRDREPKNVIHALHIAQDEESKPSDDRENSMSNANVEKQEPNWNNNQRQTFEEQNFHPQQERSSSRGNNRDRPYRSQSFGKRKWKLAR